VSHASNLECPSGDFTDRAAVRWHIAAYWRFYTRHTVELTALRQAALVNAEFGAAGRTLPGRPDVVLAMFAGLLDGFGSHWQLSGGQLGERLVDEDEAIDALTDFVYRALNGRPG
jgi:hypothetical protein